MNIQFTGHKFEITDALRQFTEKKFAKLNHHDNSITSIHVTFFIVKLDQIAEATIHVKGKDIYAKAQTTDMYNTIDALVDKLVAQLEKYKGKHSSHA